MRLMMRKVSTVRKTNKKRTAKISNLQNTRNEGIKEGNDTKNKSINEQDTKKTSDI